MKARFGDPVYARQFVHGYHLGLYVAAAIAFAGAAVAVALVRKGQHLELVEATAAA